MKRKLLALVTGGLVLTGCSGISSGEITAKVHEPDRTYVTTFCRLVGKVTVCTPQTIFDSEDWRFDLIQHATTGEDKTGSVYVSEATFGQYEVGDYYQETKR